MDMLVQQQEAAMRDQAPTVTAWLRHELGARYGAVVREAVPQEMLDMLADRSQQD